MISAFYVRIMNHIVKTKGDLSSFGTSEKSRGANYKALKLLLLLLSSNLLVWLPLLVLSILTYSNVEVPHSVSR